MLASLADCGFNVAHTYEGWRYMLALGGAPSLLMFLGFLLVLPEVLGSTAVRRPCLSAGVHCPQQTPAADPRRRARRAGRRWGGRRWGGPGVL